MASDPTATAPTGQQDHITDSGARCVPLCAAGDHVAWWHHEWPCPVRQEHEAAKREYDRLLTIGHPSNRREEEDVD